MYQVELLKTCLAGLVGFSQRIDPAYPSIGPSLTASSSGLYVDKVHAICTTENLYNAAPNFKNFQYPDWVTGTSYKKDDYVKNAGKIYIAKADITNSSTAPGADAVNWRQTSPFDEWLTALYNQSIANFAFALTSYKKEMQSGKTILESLQLYEGPGRWADKITKQGRFVGLEATIRNAEGLAFIVNSLGMQSDTAQDELNIYLYHSQRPTPIAIKPIQLRGSYDFTFEAISEMIFGYMYQNTNSAGKWYLGYYEDDLIGQAINKDMTFEAPCASCGKFNAYSFDLWSKYLGINAIEVPASALHPTNDLFDVSAVRYREATNFGLNFSLTVKCDITEFLCKNKTAIADALSRQLALECLKVIRASTRTNLIKEESINHAHYDLMEGKKGNFTDVYKQTIKNFSYDISGLNGACLACDDTASLIEYGAV